MKLRVTGDQVLIRLDPLETMSRGTSGMAIHLPPDARDFPVTGTVLAAGPGTHDRKGRWRPTTVAKGNRVLLTVRAGHDLFIDGWPHAMVHEYPELLPPIRRIEGEGLLGVIEPDVCQ